MTTDGLMTDVEISFDDKHVEPILAGEKTVTFRIDTELDLDPGQEVRLLDEQDDCFAIATIATQCTLRADWVSFGDFVGHQSYLSTADLLDELEEYYPEKHLPPGRVVDVIVFQVSDPDVVELPSDVVDDALEELEDTMDAGEVALSHDEIRTSTHMMAHSARDAYRGLVEAHPDYELSEGGDHDE